MDTLSSFSLFGLSGAEGESVSASFLLWLFCVWSVVGSGLVSGKRRRLPGGLCYNFDE